MDTIKFEINLEQKGILGKSEIVDIFINDRNIIDIVKIVEQPFATAEGKPHLAGSYEGISPIELIENLTEEDAKNYILGCPCGNTECWPIRVKIRQKDNTIIWEDFWNYHRDWDWSELHFCFDMAQYNEEIAKLKEQMRQQNINSNGWYAEGLFIIRGYGDVPKDFNEWYKEDPRKLSNIKKIVIKEGITSIPDCAFQGLSENFEELIISDTVDSIGNYAFDGCTSLKKVKMGKNVKNIGSFAFRGCKIDFDFENPEHKKNCQENMTTEDLLKKYPDGNFEQFPGDNEFRYKVFSPLFENLYENKMIYHENGKYLLIRVENIEIMPDGFSATAIPLKFLFTNRRESNFPKKWTFRLSWDWMMLGNWLSFHALYVNITIFLDKELIKKIEKMIDENRFDEMRSVICEKEAKYWEQQQKEELQKVIQEIEILKDFEKCWNNYNPYHIKEHLDKNVIYNSKRIENQIDGAAAVWQYLQCHFKEYSEKIEKNLVQAKIGYLKNKKFCYDKVFGNYKPCLVVTQRGKSTDIRFVIEIVINDEKIIKINVDDVPQNDNWHGLIENPFNN